MVILDSDMLIGVLRGDTEAVSAMEKLERAGEKLATTAINSFELFEGAFLNPKPLETMVKVDLLLRAFDILSLNQAISKTAAEISAGLRRKGNPIDFQDIAIAAIAISNSGKLVTRNIKHFSRIKGLEVEKW